MPDIVCAEVKKSTGIFGAMLLPEKKAHDLLYEKAIEAVENFKNCKIFKFDKPLKCEIEVTERTVLPSLQKCPYIKIKDGRTYQVECETVEQLIYRMIP
ncbi:MAG: M55 family metallopeptidase [Clostridia bacterium]|nr:M55 family metallopeptidase [Clostridia bacterium]